MCCAGGCAARSCPDPVGYTATIDFLINIRTTAKPGAFDASQPRPYFSPDTSPVTSRLNPISVRCGLAPELVHFDFTDAQTGETRNLGRSLTFAFYDPDHNRCSSEPGGAAMPVQHIKYITQAHDFPVGMVLNDLSNSSRCDKTNMTCRPANVGVADSTAGGALHIQDHSTLF